MQNFRILFFILITSCSVFAQDYHLTLSSQRDGLSSAAVLSIAQDENGYLWLATPYGLNRYDGHSVKQFYQADGLADNLVNDLFVDASGLLWLDTKKGIQTYNGHQFKTISNKDSLGIPRFEDQLERSFDWLVNPPFSSKIVDTLTYQGKFYVATFGDGLYTYSKGLWETIDSQQGLFDVSIYDLFKDREGQFWIASNHGLTLFAESEFQIESFDTIKGSFDMLEFQDELWITSKTGVDRVQDSKSTHFDLTAGANFMLSINTNHNNKIQCGGIGGNLYEWNGSEFFVREDFSEYLKGQFVYDIESHLGKTYYACGGRVFVDDGNSISAVLLDSIGGMSYDLLSDNESLWIANSYGVIKIKSDSIKRYSVADGMSDQNGRVIEKDDFGNIWLGTYSGGLLQFDGAHFKTFNVNNGLNDELIKSLKWDARRNCLWLGTNNGLHRLNIDSIGDVIQIEMFATPTGYPFLYCHNKALLLRENGELLFAANTNDQTNEEHIFSYSANGNSKASIAPSVLLDSYKINNTKTSTIETSDWEVLPKGQVFDYQQNHFTFNFGAIHFTVGDYIKYQWYLEGLEDEWQPISKLNTTTYTNLDFGEYTLHLRAKVPNSDWSDTKSYSFVITPPFWATWWFILLSIVSIVYTIVSIVNQRQKKIHLKQLQEFKQLQQKANLELSALRAQFNPHFVFNVLNSIQGIILCQDEEKAIIYLNDFAKLMRMVLNHSREKTIYLSDELEFLKLYINLEQLRFEDNFKFDLQVSDELSVNGTKVPPLILQPYIENAIKHGLFNKGKGGKLSLRIYKENDFLKCTIIDNGVGRKKANAKNDKTHVPKGLTMMQERIDYLNIAYSTNDFSHTISDHVNMDSVAEGTEVELVIPLNL